ncbi:MAG: hypothetical protein ACLQG3_04010 [Terracidiphilus sp.]
MSVDGSKLMPSRLSAPFLFGTLVVAFGLFHAYGQPQAGIPLSRSLAEGKISVQFRGEDVNSVRMHVVLADGAKPFRLMVPAGTVLVSAAPDAQPVVAWISQSYEITRQSAATTPGTDPIVAVCLLNITGRVPGYKDPLRIQPEGFAEARAVLEIVDKHEAAWPMAQAAVWIAAADTSWQDMGGLKVSHTLLGGVQQDVISPADVAAALMFVDKTRMDLTSRAIWRDAKHICEQAVADKTVRMIPNTKAEADQWCRAHVLGRE